MPEMARKLIEIFFEIFDTIFVVITCYRGSNNGKKTELGANSTQFRRLWRGGFPGYAAATIPYLSSVLVLPGRPVNTSIDTDRNLEIVTFFWDSNLKK